MCVCPRTALLFPPSPSLPGFKDLGREQEFVEVVLDPNPIETPWADAAQAIVDGEAVRAADIIAGIGDRAAEAYTRLRAAETLEATEAAEQRARAEEFFREVGAVAWLDESDEARSSSR